MKVGIMQPYFFPYIGYWQLINAVDKFVIYDDVNFIKGGWINRNNILVNGKSNLINLQMTKASPNKLINEIEVLGDEKVNKKLLKTIESAYKKAPYFNEVYLIIKDVIENTEKNLARNLTYSIQKICEYIGISTEIIISSDLEKNNELSGQEKVLEICSILGANDYINAIGGIKLYSKKDFKSKGISLYFLKTKSIEYSQFTNEFQPFLSIIDIMMFNDVCEVRKMLNEYELS